MDPWDVLKRSLGGSRHSMRGANQIMGRDSGSIPIEIPETASHGTALFSPEWNEGTYAWQTTDQAGLERRGTAFIYRFPFSISCHGLPEVALSFGVEGKGSVAMFPPFSDSDEIGQRFIEWDRIPCRGENPRRRFDVLARMGHPPAARGSADCNCLRVDIMVDRPCGPEGIDVEESLLGDPEPLVHGFLKLVRYRTRQWWITRDDGPRLAPLAAAFPVSGKNLIHGFPTNVFEIPRSFEIPKALDEEIWWALLRDMKDSFVPPSYDSRLLDSYYFCAVKDAEAATLALAQALEVARTEHLNRVGRQVHGDPDWDIGEFILDRKDLGRNRWALHRHLDDIPREASLCRSSFRDSAPEHWRNIGRLWETRGNVAHGHEASFQEDGQVVTCHTGHVSQWMTSVREAIAWLEGLKA